MHSAFIGLSNADSDDERVPALCSTAAPHARDGGVRRSRSLNCALRIANAHDYAAPADQNPFAPAARGPRLDETRRRVALVGIGNTVKRDERASATPLAFGGTATCGLAVAAALGLGLLGPPA